TKDTTTSTTTTQTTKSDVEFSENIPYKSNYVLPLDTAILKDFSDNEIVYNKTTDDWRVHNAIDFSGALGSNIKAIISGVVLKVYDDTVWGKVVEVNHGNGLVAKYCGLKDVTVKKDAKLTQGQVIGKLGTVPIENTEVAHLHFETILDGIAVDPLAVMGKDGEKPQ
ncbi:MAG: M23 family metallopeptidase, partial [Oscillospiraceae bacterium]|nr:M23 family metallopeptidase [Oscillospiraceae bacterium]